MEKKILLAVDDSVHSKNAVRYAVRMSSVVKDLSYTLLNVQPGISQFLVDEAKTNLKAQSALERLKKKNAAASQAMLENCKAQLVEMGIDDKRVDVKTLRQKRGLGKNILEHAEERLYDAIVVGRRGLSRIQEMFMGGLTSSLVECSKVIPLWIVDGEVKSSKIMLTTDGSESSLRTVDHVSFMLMGNPDVQITLFHVLPRIGDFCKVDFGDTSGDDVEDIIIKGDKRCVESFLSHAHRKFNESGFQKDQIKIKEVKAISNVGKAIMEEAETGNYGTVIVGRRGISKSFFMGSVSKYVLDRTSDRALWLVP